MREFQESVTTGQTDRQTKWSLCAAMLRRRHKKLTCVHINCTAVFYAHIILDDCHAWFHLDGLSRAATARKSKQENKEPKQQHSVYLITMCHLCWRIGQCGYLYKIKIPQNFYRSLRTCTFFQVPSKSVQWFQGNSRKCLGQSEARAAIFVFRSAQKYKHGGGRWVLP